MAHIELNKDLTDTLQGKVVVLTGGSTGIGKAAVAVFSGYGAKVVFGDVNIAAAKQVAEQHGPAVHFVQCDTSSYSDQLKLFATAEEQFGRVDIVLANAAITDMSDPFAAEADWKQELSTKEIDINLKGLLFTARIGQAYLRKYGGGDIVLTASIAGWVESAGATIYTATKHGVIGVMRGLHINAGLANIRVNTVCPWLAETQMAAPIAAKWQAQGFPLSKPEDIAHAMVICATAERGGQTGHKGAARPFQGKMVWVAGSEVYELEDNINRLRPQWLGEKNDETLRKAIDYMSSPDVWK